MNKLRRCLWIDARAMMQEITEYGGGWLNENNPHRRDVASSLAMIFPLFSFLAESRDSFNSSAWRRFISVAIKRRDNVGRKLGSENPVGDPRGLLIFFFARATPLRSR